MKLSALFTPPALFLSTHLLAFFVWLIPDTVAIRKGFSTTSNGAYDPAIYITYVLLVYISIFASFHLAPTLRLSKNLNFDPKSGFSFFAISAASFVGSLFSFYKASDGLALSYVVNMISSGYANALKNNLYLDYSPGLYTLRYLSIPAAAMTLLRISSMKRANCVDVVNIISIILTSILASRMAVMWVSITAFSVHMSTRTQKLSATKVAITLLFLLSILFFLNHSRNKLYYETIGADNIISSGFAEMSAYLGTPVQGAIFALKNIGRPALAQEDSSLIIENSLTTNSALLEILISSGSTALVFWYLCLLLISFSMGMIYKSKSQFIYFLYCTMLYPFAELWRVNLFNKGITIAIVSSIIVFGLAGRFVTLPLKRPHS